MVVGARELLPVVCLSCDAGIPSAQALSDHLPYILDSSILRQDVEAHPFEFARVGVASCDAPGGFTGPSLSGVLASRVERDGTGWTLLHERCHDVLRQCIEEYCAERVSLFLYLFSRQSLLHEVQFLLDADVGRIAVFDPLYP